MFKIKENNIKLYKLNLFNPINSSKSKKDIDIINEDEELERKIREKRKRISYVGLSQNKLNIKMFMEFNKNIKEENLLNKKKEDKKVQFNTENKKESNKNITTRKRNLSLSLHNKFNRLKTFTAEIEYDEKNKIQTSTKKRGSESKKI